MRYGGPMVFSSEDNDICDEEDVLVDVPSNGSFPQAELLHMIWNKQKSFSDSLVCVSQKKNLKKKKNTFLRSLYHNSNDWRENLITL